MLSSLLGVIISGTTIEAVVRPLGGYGRWLVRKKGPYNYSHVENLYLDVNRDLNGADWKPAPSYQISVNVESTKFLGTH